MITDLGTKVIELRLGGLSLRKIAKMLNCSKSSVSKWCMAIKSNDNIRDQIIQTKRKLADDKRQKKLEIQLLKQTTPVDQQYNSAYNAKLRKAAKAFLMLPANSACQNCGYNKCRECLAFHHINQLEKRFSISGTKLHYKLLHLISEAKKCILICHNCHGEVHAGLLDINHLIPLNFDNLEIPNNLIKWYVETGEPAS